LQIQFFFILLYRVNNKTMMKVTEQTKIQLERAIRRIAEKFPANPETSLLTDIHLRVTQETGELMAFDDDDNEIMRCIIEQWIDNKDEDFYESVTATLRNLLHTDLHDMIEKMSILRPFAFVLEDDDHEHIAELYCADGDTIILNGELLPNLDKDLDDFLDQLIKA